MEHTEKAEKSGKFVKGIFILSLGGFIAKIIGALYRIPLTNIVGSYGMGVYQLVFPLYALLLMISTAGIPVAVSKLVAEQTAKGDSRGAKRIFLYALLLLSIFGLIGSAVLYGFSTQIAALQGNAAAATAYKLISPSVLLVCVISAFRGYFQGQMSMAPTALSQIAEQFIKLALGLYLAIKFLPDILKGVFGAVLAVTVSEVVALILLISIYFFRKIRKKSISAGKVFPPLRFKSVSKKLFMLCVPITLSGIVIPLMQLIDSVLVLNLLKTPNATELYGIWAGPVHSLLNLPVALTLGIAASIVPAISGEGAVGNSARAHEKTILGFKMTVVFALPAMLGLFVLAKPVVTLLYGGLTADELTLAAQLVQIAALGILLLAIVQTATAVLQAGGQLYAPVIALLVAAVAKTVLNVILLRIPSVGIYGAAVASTACFLIACIIDLMYISKRQNIKLPLFDLFAKPLACALVMTFVILALRNPVLHYLPNTIGTLLLIAAGCAAYCVMLPVLQVFDKEESLKVPILGRIMKRFNR